MAKRPKPGKCVHCLSDPVERNWDHVFPESWYPDSSAPNLEKWKVPSCIPCNSALGVIEDDFLRKVALCLDPDDPASSSIVAKAMRGMKPSAASNEREWKIRSSVRQKVLADVLEGSAIPQTGIFPAMGEKWGRPLEEQTAILIPADYFERLTKKIVRGISYLEDQKFIEPPYDVDFFVLDSDGAKEIREAIAKFGSTYAREPGIVVRRVVAHDDGMSALFEIEFWHQFKTYASIDADS